ncbi:hypothetical protein KZO83_07525 [Chromohalobacter sp. TMW 2.2308]|uniref:hypothetical protein n=1 Tax=Chromohalobacter TaxID=42054 RepID=UPI001FFD7BD2|nr:MULTISPECIES: hypothetical protein [Chromohalobacter]MCK2042537.1 hypothetical protein [Chromohalobacter moromii]MCT8514944.1 hypothetical protein [Chromohalobacter sp. TMW 2.2271]
MDIPDYNTWSRDDLIDQTHRLACRMSQLAGDPDSTRERRHGVAARYHAAYAALLGMTEPFDIAARERLAKAQQWNLDESERHERLALGMEAPAGRRAGVSCS